MFNLSGSEIIFILLLALVILGPEKLPDALRRAGRTYAELKRMGNTFQSEVRGAFDEPVKEMRETADMLRKAATFDGSAALDEKPRVLLQDPGERPRETVPAASAPAAASGDVSEPAVEPVEVSGDVSEPAVEPVEVSGDVSEPAAESDDVPEPASQDDRGGPTPA